MLPLPSNPLFAFWPFASGAMLFWGLAALVPIVIHLWNRRRYREVPWAAMEYLLAALRRHSRRILVEQWILLAIRTLILVLFAIALAEPLLSWLPSATGGLGSSGQTHWVLVIDGSYSMAAAEGGVSRFDRAKQLASQLVSESNQGDGFTLVLMEDVPQGVIRSPAFAPKDVQEELDALRPAHGGARLSSALAEVESILAAARDKQRRLTEAKVCLFTDLGRTTWDEAATDAVRQQLARLAEKASLHLFDVGDERTDNVAITRLDIRDALATPGRETSLEVELQNFGSEAAGSRQLELFIDGRRTHTQAVDIRPGGKLNVTLAHTFETPGEHRIEARLGSDLVEIDNHRFASLPVRASVKALCIQGAAEEARNLAIALEPQQNERQRVDVTVASESALLEKDLTEFDIVFLSNIGRFSRDEGAVLERYVRQGGGLVLFLGDQVQIESYNEQLGAGEHRLLPVRLAGVAQTAEYRLNPLQYRHPIVAAFAGHERAGLLTTPVWKYLRLEMVEGARARTALAFDSGDPAIVTEQIGRGQVVVVAIPASTRSVDATTSPPTPWTALSTWPSFPPLVQETLAFTLTGRQAQRNLQVGDDIAGVVPNATVQQTLVVAAPDGRTERVPLKSQGQDAVWSYGPTGYSGMYEARFGAPRDMTELYALNVNTRESDLERVDVESLPEQLTHDAPRSADAPVALATSRPAELFRYFLGGVLVLLLVETVFAWRIGSGAR